MVRATRSIPWTPRLPMPTAIVPPGATLSRRRLPRINRRIVPGTSTSRGCGIDCRTRAKHGNTMGNHDLRCQSGRP